jgi:hypothetical protein
MSLTKTLDNIYASLSNAEEDASLKSLLNEAEEYHLQEQLTQQHNMIMDLQRRLAVLEEDRPRKRVRRERVLSEYDMSQFWQTWQRKYVCSYFMSNDCRFNSRQCKRLHESAGQEDVLQELRRVARSNHFRASSLFSKFLSEHNCLSTALSMKKHVEDICIN